MDIVSSTATSDHRGASQEPVSAVSTCTGTLVNDIYYSTLKWFGGIVQCTYLKGTTRMKYRWMVFSQLWGAGPGQKFHSWLFFVPFKPWRGTTYHFTKSRLFAFLALQWWNELPSDIRTAEHLLVQTENYSDFTITHTQTLPRSSWISSTFLMNGYCKAK